MHDLDSFDPADLPILSVDLRRAACRSDSTPEGWTDADIDRAVDRYRRFLALCRVSPGVALAPTLDIDLIWRLHMGTPGAYYVDCLTLFGGILDHDGGFGSTPEERPTLIAHFEQTARRWEQAFGFSYVAGEVGRQSSFGASGASA
ncbi:MAG: hypothetical protein CVU56_26070 [Deltaproteobacteria bacterium HGW-Deltaproteobacteria-14]|jgi:hypothetical protein|nr:MAG: hypothetical protein CVU56_26070 [Deltaproteobacteria bacterium HGW-Deltaproteobacteria-14]